MIAAVYTSGVLGASDPDVIGLVTALV